MDTSTSPPMEKSSSINKKESEYEITETLDNEHLESNDASLAVNKEAKKSRTTEFFNVVFSGFALLSDGYQSGSISFVNLALGKIYGNVIFNDTVSSRLSYAMFVGSVVGQLVRKKYIYRKYQSSSLAEQYTNGCSCTSYSTTPLWV